MIGGAVVGTGSAMTSNPPAELIVFVHVPKTAGMTLRALFRRMYGSEAVYTARNPEGGLADPEPLVQMPESELSRYRAVVGHLQFGIHELIDRPVRYVTFLREPIDRTLSDYYYLRRTHSASASVRRYEMAEYLRRGELANLQTRLIGGTLAERAKPADEADLARAKERIDQCFDAVGVIERFDESVLLMGEALGWRFFFHRPENVGARPDVDTVDPEHRAIIEEINRLDIELYQHARRRVDSVIAARGRRFAAKARLLGMVSRGSEAALRSPVAAPLRAGWRRTRRFAVRS